MQALTLCMIVVVTTFDYLAEGDRWGRFAVLPGAAPYLAEILGIVVLLYVVLAGSRTRFAFVRPIYWFLFSALLAVTVCGFLANSVEAGPIFAGLRSYLRALPWFFLPAIYVFSDRQIATQLRVLLVICLIQLPLAIEQRIKTGDASAGMHAVTGDWTVGTLMISSILSIFLIAAICIVAALYLDKRLNGRQFLLLFLALLVPTLLNETKGTLFLLPIGLLLVFLHGAKTGVRVKHLGGALILLTIFFALYISVYDQLIAGRSYAVPVGQFFSDHERLESYLLTGKGVGTIGEVGRLDALLVPLQWLAKDPVRLALGVGMGNASDSALGMQFAGHYFYLFKPFLTTAFSRFVLEIGTLGVAILAMVYWAIFRDSRALVRYGTGLRRTLAISWAGVTVIMAIALFYKDVQAHASLSYLFWYFSGLIAAERMRLARGCDAQRS